MSTSVLGIGPHVELLAERLQADMAGRRLQAGEPYLTSSQASEMLGVSRATAYRALRLLADRNILIARDRSGMFVSEEGALTITNVLQHATANGRGGVKQIYIIEPSDRPSTGVRFDQLMIGLRQEFPDATISFVPLPAGQEIEFLKYLVASDVVRRGEAAFIPLSIPGAALDVLVEQSGLPIAVLGSVSKELETVASVDADQLASGELLADYLCCRGHRRILAVMNQIWRQGDHAFFDAMQERLAKDSLPANALTVRSFHFQPDEIIRGVTSVLSQADAPTAIVCRYPELVPMVESAAQQSKASNGSAPEIVFGSSAKGQTEFVQYAHTEPLNSFAEYGQELARLLKSMQKKKSIEQLHVSLPIALKQPAQKG